MPSEERTLNVEVQQNESVYDPFQPAVLAFRVTDAAGRPVRTTFSVAVREKDANITASHDGGLCAETSGSVSSSGIEAEKVAADGNAQKLTGESRRELIAVISAAIAETIGTDAAGLRIKSIKKIG